MGVDLMNANGDYKRFNWSNWRALLELAYEYGWKPAGTAPPQWQYLDHDGNVDHERTKAYWWCEEDWSGTYFYNERQWVTEEDAANIAEALERTLEDIPDEQTDEDVQAVELDPWVDIEPESFGNDAPLSPVDGFGGREDKR